MIYPIFIEHMIEITKYYEQLYVFMSFCKLKYYFTLHYLNAFTKASHFKSLFAD